MFEIGKVYKIRTQEGESVSEAWNCKVIEVEGSLVKFDHAGKEWILNTASPAFISATPQD